MSLRLVALTAFVLIVGGFGPAAHSQSGSVIVFQDDFSQDTGAWVVGPRESGTRVIEGGQLRITDFDTFGTTASYLLADSYSDLEIALDTTLLSGNDRAWHVLYLRYRDKDNHHGFAIHAGGRVYGYTTIGGKRVVWQEIAPFAPIGTGFGQLNRIRVTITGDHLRFTVNGELVAETVQPGLSEGQVGLAVSTPSGDSAAGPAEVAFDNVTIRVPTRTKVVQARCDEIGVLPPEIRPDDETTVRWAWVTRDPVYLDPHRAAVTYTVTLDGKVLAYGDPRYETTDAGDYTLYALAYYVDIGRLAAGTHRIDYVATWSTAISTGRSEYGPGTENPVQLGGCTFEVIGGTAEAAELVVPAAGSLSVETVVAVDYAAIAAQVPLPVDPSRIEQTGDNGAGLPVHLSYAFEPEEIAPGVFVDTEVGWVLTDTEIQPALRWEFRAEGEAVRPVEFIADIPKSFAEKVSEIEFSVPPTEIIAEDPIVKWVINVGEKLDRTIDARTTKLMELSHPSATIELLEQFQQGVREINVRRQLQACQRMTGSLDPLVCTLQVIAQNRETVGVSLCGHLPAEPRDDDDAIFTSACYNILQPRDNLHCSGLPTAAAQNTCLILSHSILAASCESLSGVDRSLCLYDVAVHMGRLSSCDLVDDADMARDCRAELSRDPTYCADISDVTRRNACCAIFEANAEQYAECLGDHVAESGDEPIEEGETLTLGEVLGTDGSGGDAESDSAFGPLPSAPDLGYLMNPAFFAEYSCEGYSERERIVARDGQFYYGSADEGSAALPANLVGTMDQQKHDEFTGASLFYLGTPGFWMPLDGSVYSLPAVVQPWATDADSYDSYSALELRPSLDTVAVAGDTVDTVRYEGAYTEETVINKRDSTFTNGYFGTVDAYTFRAWYAPRTGLLIKSHFQRQPVSCVREGDYADDECPPPLELICTLAETSLPRGR